MLPREWPMTEKQVLEIIDTIPDKEWSLGEIIVEVVKRELGNDKFTEQALRLAQERDFAVRDAVWRLMHENFVEFTPARDVRRKKND